VINEKLRREIEEKMRDRGEEENLLVMIETT
jgi:hypothetical protein